ncbi:TPA: cyd operon protein YbgE [Mannheimia haemolytica]|uniref:Cyd operon protein YbgE n=1 Tax=Mannheimia haemolytica TaxID=75985 RepID=A0A248ZYR8_MANHA|nr:cyd operon protein YbgE [Mannheimia haemolytica]AWW71098.1 cyd operon protein YbgE [Pasteurellaceae bacterium 12565]AGI32225.1 cyd operon protein YbgE [Mannheimia haemolytica USDA-ARS-USMARC-183]AGI35631.1 cyd operon protein YbgE [Mannheimia haemolytica USDA-ARS-USMARC-185]AGK02945.1 cyd operon protein YbgE [Mannheimia haemolytica M42548]AGQ25042.1 cyd operon protein YbgE [Mannheimia haemolytica D153]
MIHKLYNLTAKGLLKALSFILAAVLFATIWVNSTAFALSFGGKTPYLAMLVFYGMAILWVHGIGFEIRAAIWKVIFLPLLGYLIVIPALWILLVK